MVHGCVSMGSCQFTAILCVFDIAAPAIMGNRVPLKLCVSDVPLVFRHVRTFVCSVLKELKGC